MPPGGLRLVQTPLGELPARQPAPRWRSRSRGTARSWSRRWSSATARVKAGAFLTTRAAPPAPLVIPAAALPPGARVDYYVRALDAHGGTVAESGTPALPFRLQVAAPPAARLARAAALVRAVVGLDAGRRGRGRRRRGHLRRDPPRRSGAGDRGTDEPMNAIAPFRLRRRRLWCRLRVVDRRPEGRHRSGELRSRRRDPGRRHLRHRRLHVQEALGNVDGVAVLDRGLQRRRTSPSWSRGSTDRSTSRSRSTSTRRTRRRCTSTPSPRSSTTTRISTRAAAGAASSRPGATAPCRSRSGRSRARSATTPGPPTSRRPQPTSPSPARRRRRRTCRPSRSAT